MRGTDAYRAMYGYSPFRQAGRGGGAGSLNAYDEAVLALNPVAYLPMKAGTLGTNLADVPDVQNGTPTSVTETTGQVDTAGIFNGTTSQILVPEYAAINDLTAQTQTMSAEMVLKLPAGNPGTDQNLLTKGQNSATNTGWIVQYTTAGLLHCYIFATSNWLRFTSSAALPKDTWFHLAWSMTADGFTAKELIWVNGVSVATTHQSNYVGVAGTDTFPLMVGTRYTDGTPPGDSYLSAEIDCVAVYDYQPTTANFLANAQAAGLA